jgi:hypothetical protein
VDPEDSFEAPARLSARQAVDPASQPADPPGLDQRQQEQQQDRDAEADDDRAEVRRDDGVEVDGRLLRNERGRV